jgi:cytochrome P450 / NADPH-cytochrome P450 reductase
MPVQSILSDFVELGQPAMRRDVSTLAKGRGLSTEDKLALEWLASDGFEDEIVKKRTSVLDILERYTSIDLPFGTFLSMLPNMRLRQ